MQFCISQMTCSTSRQRTFDLFAGKTEAGKGSVLTSRQRTFDLLAGKTEAGKASVLTSRQRIVDLFAGGGGLTIGFSSAGFELAAAFENWEPAINLYRENFTHPVYRVDLSKEEAVNKIARFEPDVIVGGPPCQDFSSAGKRDESLGRSALTICFAEIVSRLAPRHFVMENVERALHSITMKKAMTKLRECGYGLTTKVLNASNYGVPQNRKRLFVIGELGASENFLSELLEERRKEKRMTVRDWVGDSFGITHYYRHPRSYKRRGIFSIDEPSPTVRGVNRPVPKGYPGHPGDPVSVTGKLRCLTTRERSLIQTYPKNFKLVGSKTNLEQIIGNAVPVNLARHVAQALIKRIESQVNRQPFLTDGQRAAQMR